MDCIWSRVRSNSSLSKSCFCFGESDAANFSFVREEVAFCSCFFSESAVLPIYPLTEGLSQKVFRKTVALALKQYGMGIDDEIPQEIISERKLLSKKHALVYVHVPATISQAKEARATLIYEELYLFGS